jgi:hypothetical protein
MPYSITNGLCTLADVKAALRLTDTTDDDRISLAIDSTTRLIEKACNRRFWQDPAPRTGESCTLTLGSSSVADTSIVATDAGRSVTGTGVPPGAVVTNPVAGVGFQLTDYFQNPLLAIANGAQSLTIGLSPRHFVSNDPWLVEVDDISTTAGLIVQSDYAGDGTFGTFWQESDFQAEPVNGILNGQAGWPITAIRAIRSLYFPVWGGISYPRPYTQALVSVTARWGWAAVPSDVNEAAIIQSIATFKGADVPFGATPFGETGVVRLRQSLHPTACLLLDPYFENDALIA